MRVQPMYDSEISSKLAEIKRLSNLAAAIAPSRKSDPPRLSEKDLEMIQDLLNRLKALATEVEGVAAQMKEAEEAKKTGALGPIDQDVLSALLSLGCKRSQAEAAVRKARAAAGASARDFEPLFRRALELVR
jgi:Holliday junction resolvasome RuvABC DNA-binding subunit